MATREREPITGRGSPNSGSIGNLDEIKELIDLIIEKGISEFELERSGLRIKIARSTTPEVTAMVSTVPGIGEGQTPANNVLQPQHSNSAAKPSAPPRPSTAAEEVQTVRSPMVGTFYACPAPGTDPFVRPGDRIQRGQVLCIIEAMKLMNEIEAEMAGEIIQCHVENGQPVEYGEPLFDIRPLGPNKRGS